MTATDKKRRRLAQTIGESFAAIRRRTARSQAWLSLSAPAIKIYVELRLRWRYKDGNNNGALFISLRECETLLHLSRAGAVRGFAELEAKGFVRKTRQGEAGRLPASGTLDNGGTGFARRATWWALTDEPCQGQPPTHAYEQWRPPDSERPKKQFHVSAGGPSISTIYPALPERAPTQAPTQRVRPAARSPMTPPVPKPPTPKGKLSVVGCSTAISSGGVTKNGSGWYGARVTKPGLLWPGPERVALGMTQQQLADRAGVHRAVVASIERGRRRAGAKVRERIERALLNPTPQAGV